MIGGKQVLSIMIGDSNTGTCLTADTVAHEFIHALAEFFFYYLFKICISNNLIKPLGFAHEQSRPDRDKYVEYHPENLADRIKLISFLIRYYILNKFSFKPLMEVNLIN